MEVYSSSSSLLLPASLSLLAILSLFYLLRRNPKTRTAGPLPKARQLIIKGRSFLEWSTDLLLAAPDATITFPGGRILTADPSIVEHVLKTNFSNYPKGQTSNFSMFDLLGNGIFNTDGPHWHLQRRVATLGFNSKSLRFYSTDVFNPEITARLLPFLSRGAATGRTIDLQDLFDRFSFDAVCRVAFGFDPALLASDSIDANSKGARFSRAFESAMALALNRQRPHLWRIPRFLGVGNEAWLKEELAILNEFAMGVVEDSKNRVLNPSLMGPFIEAGGFEDNNLRDVILNYVLAGRDTTSSALTWFFYLISSRPEIRRKILGEISGVRERRSRGDGVIWEVEELRKMEYLHAAITEAMRLYPPVPLDYRRCSEGDELPGKRKAKKGGSVNINMYAMGRMESIWGQDCREYRPERWLNEMGEFEGETPYRFPIFFGGPRMCLGKEMAYMEMKAVAAAVMEEGFEFEAESGEEGRGMEVVAVLRMKGGFLVKVRKRWVPAVSE